MLPVDMCSRHWWNQLCYPNRWSYENRKFRNREKNV